MFLEWYRRGATMLEHRHDTHAYERRLPATTSSLARFRESLRTWMADEALDEPTRATDILLAASELVAATIRSAPGPSSNVVLRAWLEEGAVVVESAADARPHARDGTAGAFDGTDSERGFSVVAALADTFAVTSRPDVTVVRASLRHERFDGMRPG
jgi:anti-sigma regulatory factor (Ser/Thr protein kinase)